MNNDITYEEIKERERCNYIIAKFMSELEEWKFRYTKDGNYHFYDNPYSSVRDEYVDGEKTGNKIKIPTCVFNFHNSWEWIMPVIERIESLKIADITYHSYKDGNAQLLISVDGTLVTGVVHNPIQKKEAYWKAIVKFISWYNENISKCKN